MTFDQLLDIAVSDDLVRMVFSKPLKDAFSQKMKVRPVVVKGQFVFQVTTAQGAKEKNTYKEVHENLSKAALREKINAVFPVSFGQILVETKKGGYTVLSNKKGTITVVKNKGTVDTKVELSHNREKKYILPEGTVVPFLVDLGVMTKAGAIVNSRYDKYRQLNRYLEFIEDILNKLPNDREITIVDFGCGKSYLTFALYYYLVVMNSRRVKIIGLDLKTDVIKECNRLKNKYGYNGLTFIEGDIEHFEGVDSVDMVISLHACDTATDYALYKGILWNASVIMAVPCCQHEMNRKMNSPALSGLTSYGILKDRAAALITDAMRANLLKQWGYDTQVLEFIDMEHTPKNLLIRAVKGSGKFLLPKEKQQNDALRDLAGADITLHKLLEDLAKENETHNT